MTPTRQLTAATSNAGVSFGPTIVVDDVVKVHGHGPSAVQALDHLSLEVPRGGFTCLVGASGCGKSTLLNLLAGLDQATAGTVTVDGRISLMFQDSALFPWLTVGGNIELALKLRKVPRRVRRERTMELLESVHLADFVSKRPHELSGGMRQRVAIARAFAQDAEVLLMDEPFGALDAMTRDILHAEVERLWQERGLTIVFVTHNVREAARLAEQVVVLSSRPGRVIETLDVDIGRPRRIEDQAVGVLSAHITDLLRTEVRRHAR